MELIVSASRGLKIWMSELSESELDSDTLVMKETKVLEEVVSVPTLEFAWF